MKKYIVAAVALGAALSVLAQGTVNFSTRVTGTVVGHVYGPESATEPGKYVSKFGNTGTETPSGAQVYAGGFLTGSGWSAQLWAVNLADQLESSLAAVSPVVTFRTGTTLGGTPVPSVVTVAGVPAAGTGTFQVRVWDNVGGTLTTWGAAETQWLAGGIAAGKSATFNISNLGDGALNLPADMANFRSFNVYFNPIPEPSTFALLGLGALGMLIFRRK
jgi:hypothetical protein